MRLTSCAGCSELILIWVLWWPPRSPSVDVRLERRGEVRRAYKDNKNYAKYALRDYLQKCLPVY